MNRLLRVTALLACGALCAVLCGCGALPEAGDETSSAVSSATTVAAKKTATTTAETATADNKTPALVFDKSDSLSPYAATTRVNRALSPLLYEGLTAVNADYSTSLCLAENIKKTDGTHWVVTLKKNLKFSEGTALKASDVAASFRAAASSEAYNALVADVTSVTAKDDRTLVVVLSSAVPYAEAALSFPVVKTVNKRPVGTGAYRLNAKKTALEKNPYSKIAVNIKTFALENVSRQEEMQAAVEMGTVCMVTDDLTDGTVPRLVTDVTETPTTLPYLVYLGLNANRTPWSSAAIRVSVGNAISRTDVAAVGFSGFAVATATPFSPACAAMSGVEGASLTQNVAAAVGTWKKNGYNVTENGAVKNRLSAELIYQKQNAMHKAAANEIAKELKAAGMQVSVKALSESEYTARLASGNFDLYLGEVRLPQTLSLDALLTASGGAAYGVSAGGRTLWAQYKSGKLTAEQFVESFLKEAPFVPLCYAQGVTLSDKRLSGLSPSGVSAYDGFAQWNYT